MVISNRERVGRALETLKIGIYPFVEREMKADSGEQWVKVAANALRDDYTNRKSVEEVLKDDIAALLNVMLGNWTEVFKKTLGKSERSLVHELIATRNAWAHGDPFSLDDTYRAFDSISRLLSSISVDNQELEKQKQELLRLRFEELAKRETRRSTPVQGQPTSGLKPWREIATPHPDVASGRYQQAEFAADLHQVYLDEGSDEYRLPNEFFRRTYLTEGLKQLLTNALIRLSGLGGDPVIELQTNFGGGKTHAMLALFHLFFGVEVKDLPGTEAIFQNAKVNKPPQNVNTAVIVGNKISPGKADLKSDGTTVHTLWGEIAWQLGGKEGYEMIKQADQSATNPGDSLKDLFNKYAPCLILIDEWVSYARQLHERADLPAGSFDTHFTFAQTLSESAKNAQSTLLVVSIPSSDIEIGGDRGKEALERLKNAIGRVESPWRPASAQESFEIVRRRLFQSTTDPELFTARDAVIKAFVEMYRNNGSEFPSECREKTYEQKLLEAYPIHPELFDRLYSDWSTLDKFQRTRGVLRLMAKVIHSLWEREDKSLLIMPGHLPIDEPQVQSELTRYLDDNWVPIIEKDVDGPNSLPQELDGENQNFGRYSTCRKISRTIYLGSAPIIRAANLGLEDRKIKLGCIQPGESIGTFGDALRRLSDRSTYLYVDGNRYWISNQPNVSRTAQDRAQLFLEERYKITEEIVKRLKQDKERGHFGAVHIAPESSADIPDDPNLGVRLIVFSNEYSHSRSLPDSSAKLFAQEILNQRGSAPRYYKNTLIFLALDKSNKENLENNVAQYLAWNSICSEKDLLNLDASQAKQAATKLAQSNTNVETIIAQNYHWLLIPSQPQSQGAIEWLESKLSNNEDTSAILRASRKLEHEEHIIKQYSGARLRMEALDPYLWKDSNDIDLKRLWEYLAQYLYLPRLKNPEVLLEAIKQAVSSIHVEENFAYAEGWDQSKQKYLALVRNALINPILSSQSLLVKPEIAYKQIENTSAINTTVTKVAENIPSTSYSNSSEVKEVIASQEQKPVPKRFYGTVELDALRINLDARAIASEIIEHLTKLNGSQVKIILEIEAQVPDGVPEEVVRTVSENCRTLKFINQSFEQQ